VGDVTNGQKNIVIIVALLAVVGYSCFSYGRNTATADSAGLDPIRADIQRVIQQQQNIIAVQHTISVGLDKSVKGIETISERIAGIEGVVGEVAGRVDSDRARLIEQQRLIDAGQSIVGGRK
jgi:hypothetical protein